MEIFEGKIVYCVDEASAHYGNQLKVVLIMESGRPLLEDIKTGKSVRINMEQLSENPPPKKTT
jgi:hypothetical protein